MSKSTRLTNNEAAIRVCLESIDEEIDIAVVALALALAPGVAMGKNVADLADRDDRPASARRSLQQIAVGRRNREILAIGGADEIFGASADERPGDDAADVERIA